MRIYYKFFEFLTNSMFHIFVDFIPEVTVSSSYIGHVVISISKLIELNFVKIEPVLELD